MKLKITYGEKYGPAMEITDQAKADAYFEECVEHNLQAQVAEGSAPDRERAESVERQNLGYYAGYYDHETRKQVEKLFRCTHPVFGSAAQHEPTPTEALQAGIEHGRKTTAGS